MVKALLLIAVAPLFLADGPPPEFRRWLLQQKSSEIRMLDVQLVRARVRTVRTLKGPITIEIKAPSRQLGAAKIEVQRSGRVVAVRDVYPQSSGADGCNPPNGQRGAFWNSQVVWDATIYAPADVTVTLHVMDPRS